MFSLDVKHLIMGMKNRIYTIIILAPILLAFVGCSGYNKVLKSEDAEYKYRMALEYFEQGKYQRTIQLLADVQHIFNHTTKSDSVEYYLASAFYKRGEFETSAQLFDQFRQTYNASPFLEDVEYMYAMGFYFSSPAPNRDQTPTNQAILAMTEYLNRYPESIKKELMQEYIQELTQKLHDKAFINAKSYYTTRRYKSAVVSLRNALNQYPESSHREEIMYLTVKSSYLLAKNSYESLMRERYLDMIDYYYSFISEFPESDSVKELDRMEKEAKAYLEKFQDGDSIEGDVNEGSLS